jgi:hypothetical protein
MRCSPSIDHPGLLEFDKILRSAICKITNCDLSENQWLQAGLPIRDGGLGIRRVSSLALPAFLASAAGSLSLQDAILSQADTKPDSYFALYLPRWSEALGVVHHPINSCQENNLSGIGHLFFPTNQQLKLICRRNTEKLPFSPRQPHTVEIGFYLCLLRPVVSVWRTMRYAPQSL